MVPVQLGAVVQEARLDLLSREFERNPQPTGFQIQDIAKKARKPTYPPLCCAAVATRAEARRVRLRVGLARVCGAYV